MRGIQRDLYLPRAILNKIPHLAHLHSLAYLHMRRSLKCTTCEIFFQNCGCNALRTKPTLGVSHTPSCVFCPFCTKIPSPHIGARLNAQSAKFSFRIAAVTHKEQNPLSEYRIRRRACFVLSAKKSRRRTSALV